MQLAGDIGRRHNDAERPAGGVYLRREIAGVPPGLIDAPLHGGGVIGRGHHRGDGISISIGGSGAGGSIGGGGGGSFSHHTHPGNRTAAGTGARVSRAPRRFGRLLVFGPEMVALHPPCCPYRRRP